MLCFVNRFKLSFCPGNDILGWFALCRFGKHVDDDELVVDLAGGTIKDVTRGIELTFVAFPDAMLKILSEGGLLPYIKKYGDFVVGK